MGKQAGNASTSGTSSYLSNSYGYVGAKPGLPIIPIVLGIAAVILVIAIVLAIRSCAAGSNENDNSTSDTAAEASTVTPSTVHFVAVGDNLPEDQIGTWADAQSGTTGDGCYNYTGIYKNIKPYIESADLAYVKEETHCGGDEIGPRGYPSFLSLIHI